jgi:DNA-binding Lrp family transcriptional regulator
MKTGFILIKNKPGKEYKILKKLENIIEIDEIYPIFGEYDFLIKLRGKDLDELGKIIINKIRVIDGINDTITLTESSIKRKVG